MTAVGVIPARWSSTRLPGKVLLDIGGKSMLQLVWERAQQATTLSDVIVACDEPHVLEAARAFGANAIMTRPDHPSGSDRVAEAVKEIRAEIVVNIQGDEPFMDPSLIDRLVNALDKDPVPLVATAIKRFANREDFQNPNIVKVVVDKNNNAMYFSRSPIPFHRDGLVLNYAGYFRHIGIYAYRREFLLSFCLWPKSFLEQEECLEQLRILEQGIKIRTVETSEDSLGIDTAEDLEKAKKFYEKKMR